MIVYHSLREWLLAKPWIGYVSSGGLLTISYADIHLGEILSIALKIMGVLVAIATFAGQLDARIVRQAQKKDFASNSEMMDLEKKKLLQEIAINEKKLNTDLKD